MIDITEKWSVCATRRL